MSRQIHIEYQDHRTGTATQVDVPAPYFLFGTQQSSMTFWSIPRVSDIGCTELSRLGYTGPVFFFGWEGMEELGREIDLLRAHLAELDFHPTLKAEWVAHLVYCFHLLMLSVPKESQPVLSIE